MAAAYRHDDRRRVRRRCQASARPLTNRKLAARALAAPGYWVLGGGVRGVLVCGRTGGIKRFVRKKRSVRSVAAVGPSRRRHFASRYLLLTA